MKKYIHGTLTVLLFFAATHVCATTIQYSTSDLGGGRWQYDYTVINDSLGSPLFEFTIDFDRTLYGNLTAISAPANWDGLVVDTGSFIDLNNGFYDGLMLLPGGLGVSESASVFSVQFDWLGGFGLLPGAQPFVIVDPNTFAVLDEGLTTALVPVPSAVLLFISGLAVLIGFRNPG